MASYSTSAPRVQTSSSELRVQSGRWRKNIQICLFVGFAGWLALAPFLNSGVKPVSVAAQCCIYIVLACSYDLLLGYTGIVSFAHAMFFGIGAYSVAIFTNRSDGTWQSLVVGTAIAVVVSTLVALLIGLFSLRVTPIFFSMITLAVASFFTIIVAQLRDFTGGSDGTSVAVPDWLTPGFKLMKGQLLGIKINGRVVSYYLVFFAALILFLLMLRVVSSPFGRVIQAIRENPMRAEAIGYRTVTYRVQASCLSAVIAALAGVLMAVWVKFITPDNATSFNIMVDVLLMVVIGGMGTIYGAALGAILVVLANYYLSSLMSALGEKLEGLPVLPELFRSEHWLLWLGIIYVLSVYFFPKGIVGKLRPPQVG